MAAKRLTAHVSTRQEASKERYGLTRLRVEVLGIADLDRPGGAMNRWVVVYRVFLRDLFRINGRVRLALCAY